MSTWYWLLKREKYSSIFAGLTGWGVGEVVGVGVGVGEGDGVGLKVGRGLGSNGGVGLGKDILAETEAPSTWNEG